MDFSSGNEIVDRMASINVSGNITPPIWYQSITKNTGKPYLLAISILSDIVYWYRPSEIRDEQTGQMVGRKKFKGEYLQKTYQQYANLFGESKRSIKAAMDCLECLGVIERIFNDITIDNGMKLRNVMYIRLIADRLYELTYPETFLSKIESIDDECDGSESVEGLIIEGVVQKNVPRGTEKSNASYEKMYHIPPQDVPHDTEVCEINTYTTTKNVTKNTKYITTENLYINTDIYPINQEETHRKRGMDLMDYANTYRSIVEENLDYDYHDKYDDYPTHQLYLEIFNLVSDVVCVQRDTIRIGKVEYPYELVKSRFLQLTGSHIDYVMDSMKHTSTHIKNIRAYLLESPYNSLSTINSYYRQKVQHDMYGDG